MDMHDEMTWIFSGVGTAVVTPLLAWIVAKRLRRKPPSLARVMRRIDRTSLATNLPASRKAILGMRVTFKGRVLRATTSDRIVTVTFDLRRSLPVRCAFEIGTFPTISLVMVGDKVTVKGEVVSVNDAIIDVRPLPDADDS